jgi:hypothetical protein
LPVPFPRSGRGSKFVAFFSELRTEFVAFFSELRTEFRALFPALSTASPDSGRCFSRAVAV